MRLKEKGGTEGCRNCLERASGQVYGGRTDGKSNRPKGGEEQTKLGFWWKSEFPGTDQFKGDKRRGRGEERGKRDGRGGKKIVVLLLRKGAGLPQDRKSKQRGKREKQWKRQDKRKSSPAVFV